jgi:Tfp pilus assembly protein PilW
MHPAREVIVVFLNSKRNQLESQEMADLQGRGAIAQ